MILLKRTALALVHFQGAKMISRIVVGVARYRILVEEGKRNRAKGVQQSLKEQLGKRLKAKKEAQWESLQSAQAKDLALDLNKARSRERAQPRGTPNKSMVKRKKLENLQGSMTLRAKAMEWPLVWNQETVASSSRAKIWNRTIRRSLCLIWSKIVI